MRYRLDLVAASVADVVTCAGGWLCDRVMAGWDVTVLVGEHEPMVPARAEVFQSLGVTGALELLNAYAKIPDLEVRRAILHMTKAVSRGGEKANAA